jgi:hypothetical protein
MAGVVALTGTLALSGASRAADDSAGPGPTWRLTGVLLIDRPPSDLAFGLQAREEGGRTPAFDLKVGNWDPRTRLTGHATLPRSRAAWRLSTGVREWPLSADEVEQFRHHIFLIDRPVYHQPDGKEKERVLHLAMATDVVAPGARVPVRWRWQGEKGLEPLTGAKPAAFLQQAPAFADDEAGWAAPVR